MRRIGIGELLASEERVRALADELARGAVAAVPTETFYGLAAAPSSAAGVGRILSAKGRGDGKPLLVLFAERTQLSALGIRAPDAALDPFFALWPAPLTVVLPISAPIPASLGAATLAVRMPAHPELRRLLVRTGPLTGTSANRAGEPPCVEPEDVARLFGDAVDVLVDGGRTRGGEPSTLLDATVDPPRVLRPGAHPWPPANR